MRVVLRENFHQFFTRHANDERSDFHGQSPKALLDTLQVLNRFGTFSDHEWEIAHLYLVIVLEKMPEGYSVRAVADESVALTAPCSECESMSSRSKHRPPGYRRALPGLSRTRFGARRGSNILRRRQRARSPPRCRPNVERLAMARRSPGIGRSVRLGQSRVSRN